MASVRGVGWIFRWMTRRTAAAYGLLGEATLLLHEQRLGFDCKAQRALLFNTIAASRYLKLLLVALRPGLETGDEGPTLVALADFGARYRPRLGAEARSRVGYIDDLLGRASRESGKVRRLLACVGERRSAAAQALDEIAVHLAEARAVLDGRYAPGVGLRRSGPTW